MSPLSRVGKLSRERVPELAQGLPAGLETGGTLILAYSPGRVVGYLQGILGPVENRLGPKGEAAAPAQSYQQFLGSKWQGAEGGIPESVALAGCGHPRCSSHSLCSGQKRNGLLCAKNPCPGPKPAVPSAQARVGSSIWIFFSV